MGRISHIALGFSHEAIRVTWECIHTVLVPGLQMTAHSNCSLSEPLHTSVPPTPVYSFGLTPGLCRIGMGVIQRWGMRNISPGAESSQSLVYSQAPYASVTMYKNTKDTFPDTARILHCKRPDKAPLILRWLSPFGLAFCTY